MTLHLEMILSELLFLGIVIFSLFIWYEFYISRDGKLRILIMELFLAKCWVYGLAGVYYLLVDFGYFDGLSTLWLRIACNLPMCIVMVRLYRWIKWKN